MSLLITDAREVVQELSKALMRRYVKAADKDLAKRIKGSGLPIRN
jgi:hypothetical protein